MSDSYIKSHLQISVDAVVIIPTLNERDNITTLIEYVLAADQRLHVVVVDDGSTDGTAEAVSTMMERHIGPTAGRVHLIQRGKKMGLASAIQDGIRFALHHGARLILQMDADFSHDPRYLPEILAHSDHYDLVLGSRYVAGGGTVSWPLHRQLLSRSASLFVRTLLGLPVMDCTGGFRCWKASVLESLDVVDLTMDGYAFQFAALYIARRAGASVAEVPIVFTDRTRGRSKMSQRIVVEAMLVLCRLSLERLLGRAPKKPAGIVCEQPAAKESTQFPERRRAA